jgi:Ca2+-binding EF-hand superfamily protein
MTMRCDKLQELIDETKLEWEARKQITPKVNAGETTFRNSAGENLTSRCKDIAEDRQETYYQDALLMSCEQLTPSETVRTTLILNGKEYKAVLFGEGKKAVTRLPLVDLYLVEKATFSKVTWEAGSTTEGKMDRTTLNVSFPTSEEDPLEDVMKKAFGTEEDFNNGVVTITVKAYSGVAGDWRGAVVPIDMVKRAVSEYLKTGLWFEAVEQVCRDRLGLTYSSEMLRKAFDAVDTDGNGFIEPAEFYKMIIKLFKMGMTYTQLEALMKSLNFNIDKKNLLQTFQKMDLDQSGTLGTLEFLTGIDSLLAVAIPALVLQKTGLTTAQILPRIAGVVFMLLVIFIFIMIGMSAFTGPGAASSGIQSTLMGLSAVGVKSENGAPDVEKLKKKIKDLINNVMGIDKKQVQQAEKSQQAESKKAK